MSEIFKVRYLGITAARTQQKDNVLRFVVACTMFLRFAVSCTMFLRFAVACTMFLRFAVACTRLRLLFERKLL